MKANETTVYMVRCKCQGALGVAKVAVNYAADRDAFDFFSDTIMGGSRCPSQRCLSCSRYFRIFEVRGQRSAHECGAKCMASKGPSCECACGGKNHGGAYA